MGDKSFLHLSEADKFDGFSADKFRQLDNKIKLEAEHPSNALTEPWLDIMSIDPPSQVLMAEQKKAQLGNFKKAINMLFL